MARIFEPKDQFILKWNKFITLCCVLCLALEPFFLYIPLIDRRSNCVGLDYKLKMILCILRFILDFIYMVHICIRLRTAIEMTGMSVSELVKNPRVIAKSYSLYFINDILAILPILQVNTLSIVINYYIISFLIVAHFLRTIINYLINNLVKKHELT